MSDFPNMMVQQGWQCPACKSIFSPMTSECYRCNVLNNAPERISPNTSPLPSTPTYPSTGDPPPWPNTVLGSGSVTLKTGRKRDEP